MSDLLLKGVDVNFTTPKIEGVVLINNKDLNFSKIKVEFKLS
jgi:hypothetical protein